MHLCNKFLVRRHSLNTTTIVSMGKLEELGAKGNLKLKPIFHQKIIGAIKIKKIQLELTSWM